MILVSRTVLNTNVRELLHGLDDAGLLHSLHTTFAVPADRPLPDFLPPQLAREFMRRSIWMDGARVHTYPLPEFARQVASNLGLRWLTKESLAPLCSFQIGLDLDRKVARQLRKLNERAEVQAVYGFEDAAVETFKAAKALGLATIYELPIAYGETNKRMLEEEMQRYPAWTPTISDMSDSQRKLEIKAEEVATADLIICPSPQVRDSLPGAVGKTPTVIARFGSDLTIPERSFERRSAGEKLRVLFAGSLTQRKGLADVFEAMKLLRRDDVELIVMGSCVMPLAFYKGCLASFSYEPVRPRAAVLELMRSCDLLVLPSLVEGRALVVQEAMMCGLPVLVTANTGCEDLVVEGSTGFLLPIRNPQFIAERITWFAEHKDELPEMSVASRQRALTVTWKSYQETIVHAIGGLLSKSAVPGFGDTSAF